MRGKHEQTAGCDRTRPERICGDMQQRGFNVEIGACAAGEQQPNAEVNRESDPGEDRHQTALRQFGRGKTPGRFDRDHGRNAEEQDAVHERGERFEARETVGLTVVRRAPHLDGGRDGNSERDHVHEHVRGIRQQREAMGYEAAGEFEQRDAERERQCQPERRGPCSLRMRVLVRRSHQGVFAAYVLTKSATSIAPSVTNVLDSARTITAAS